MLWFEYPLQTSSEDWTFGVNLHSLWDQETSKSLYPLSWVDELSRTYWSLSMEVWRKDQRKNHVILNSNGYLLSWSLSPLCSSPLLPHLSLTTGKLKSILSYRNDFPLLNFCWALFPLFILWLGQSVKNFLEKFSWTWDIKC